MKVKVEQHAVYSQLNRKAKNACDDAYTALSSAMLDAGFRVRSDDWAECVVEMLAMFMQASNSGRGAVQVLENPPAPGPDLVTP